MRDKLILRMLLRSGVVITGLGIVMLPAIMASGPDKNVTVTATRKGITVVVSTPQYIVEALDRTKPEKTDALVMAMAIPSELKQPDKDAQADETPHPMPPVRPRGTYDLMVLAQGDYEPGEGGYVPVPKPCRIQGWTPKACYLPAKERKPVWPKNTVKLQ